MNPIALSLILLLVAPPSLAPPLSLEKSMEAFIAELQPLDSSQEDDDCYLSEPWRDGSTAAGEAGLEFAWWVPVLGLAGASASDGPEPPEDFTRHLPEYESRCFAMGYRHRIRARRMKAGVKGTVGGIALVLLVVAALVETVETTDSWSD